MTFPGLQRQSSISLDELIALNDEIAALVRAGLPLDRGLAELADDMPGRLGRIAAALGERTERGETLGEALTAVQPQIPPLYLAVVEAGLKAGRLTAALEQMAFTARQVVELRKLAAGALVYPMVVFVLAYSLWLGFALWAAPVAAPIFESFQSGSGVWLERAAGAGRVLRYWGPAIPLCLFAALGLWWFFSGHAVNVQSGRSAWRLGWVPGGRRLMNLLQAAMFADVLSLLIEACMPLHESIVLAAEASGSRRIGGQARSLAERLRQGASFDECLASAPDFPPLLCWLLRTGQQQTALAAALRHSASGYRERARQRAEAARLFLPILLTTIIGGGTVLAYALLLFWPWTSLLKSLSEM